MWYFIAGNFVSIVLSNILIKSLFFCDSLTVLESSIGWFLIEHIFEEYSLTTGKFFLISEDFRTVIQNFLMILRNVVFLAQSFNPLEFFIINLLLICVLTFYKQTHFYNKVKICVLVTYLFLFKSFLFLNYDLIYILFNASFLVLFCLITILFYIFILYWCLTLKKNYITQMLQVFTSKIIAYLLMNSCLGVFISLALILLVKIQENILHELILRIVLIYSYLIY